MVIMGSIVIGFVFVMLYIFVICYMVVYVSEILFFDKSGIYDIYFVVFMIGLLE